MSIFAWVVLGGIAGWIASIIIGNNKSQGIFGNIVVGIAGSLIGGFLFSIFGGSGVSGFNFYSLLVAVLGSVVLLWITSKFRGHDAV